jgi:hypothetical protein
MEHYHPGVEIIDPTSINIEKINPQNTPILFAKSRREQDPTHDSPNTPVASHINVDDDLKITQAQIAGYGAISHDKPSPKVHTLL